MQYTRPYLYPKQSQAFFHPKRYGLCEASTKAGKTVAAIAWIIEEALKGDVNQNFWWVAPVSEQSKIAYTRIKNGLPKGSYVPYESPVPRINLQGRHIWFKSGDNPESLYGEDVFAAVVDEASRTKEQAWYALRSTLTATQGPVRMIGNVTDRKNWFYHLCRLAETGELPNSYYSKITILDAIAAGVLPESELAEAKATIRNERVFRALYFAEPGDDGGNPFGMDHIFACGRATLSPLAPVAFGVDLAKKGDYLVIIGLDKYGAVCSFSRWQGIPWRESIRRIHEIIGDDAPTLVDSTGLGDPVLEELQVGHGNFKGYLFSGPSKQKLMEGLAVSIQGHEIFFPRDTEIQSELESFQYELGRTGIRYSAPEGYNDDCVCALALAREVWAIKAPGQNVMDYYASSLQQPKAAQNLTSSNDPELNTVLPWQTPREEVITNELGELYDEIVRRFNQNEMQCAACKLPILGTRVSDGFSTWHTECYK